MPGSVFSLAIGGDDAGLQLFPAQRRGPHRAASALPRSAGLPAGTDPPSRNGRGRGRPSSSGSASGWSWRASRMGRSFFPLSHEASLKYIETIALMYEQTAMIAPRRYLPSIASLMALEALDRLGSASAAARNCRSPKARSVAIAGARGADGRAASPARSQAVAPVACRAGLRAPVRAALEQIAQASLKLRRTRWAARSTLRSFRHSGCTGWPARWPISRAAIPSDGQSLDASAALRFRCRGVRRGDPFRPCRLAGGRASASHGGRVLPVCAPGFLAGPPTGPAALLDHPLLLLEVPPGAWHRWMAQQGLSRAIPRGMVFDQFSTMSQAAIHGLGSRSCPPSWPSPRSRPDGSSSPGAGDSAAPAATGWSGLQSRAAPGAGQLSRLADRAGGGGHRFRLTQAAFRADERTQASTKATPATPSRTVG